MIDPAIYSEIADAYAAASDDGTTMLLEVTNIGTEFQTLQSNTNVVIGAIIVAQNMLQQKNPVSPAMISAVRALQKHVVTNVGSVDTYLANNMLTVKQAFANISASAGYPIDSSHIVG